jgi:glycosyltransferase involved in cell wall biosynthesis
MSQTRILRIITRLNAGGPAAELNILEPALASLGYNPRLLFGSTLPPEVEAPPLDVEAFKIPHLQRPIAPHHDLLALSAIRRHIKVFKPHILHTHTSKAGLLGRLAALTIESRPLLVHTYHGHLLQGYFTPMQRSALLRAERFLASKTDALCAGGKTVKRELLSAGIGTPTQYRVVPPPTPSVQPLSKTTARQALNLPPNAPVIGFIGRLTHIKRPDRFLQVADGLLTEIPNASVVIAGWGELGPKILRQSSELRGDVRLLGSLDNPGLFYAATDVVVATSDNEGIPVSLIEAASHGVPAVATNVGSTDEIVLHGSTGFVTQRDATAIIAAVLELIRDSGLRDTFSIAARTHVQRHFNSTQFITNIDDLYLSILQ